MHFSCIERTCHLALFTFSGRSLLERPDVVEFRKWRKSLSYKRWSDVCLLIALLPLFAILSGSTPAAAATPCQWMINLDSYGPSL